MGQVLLRQKIYYHSHMYILTGVIESAKGNYQGDNQEKRKRKEKKTGLGYNPVTDRDAQQKD